MALLVRGLRVIGSGIGAPQDYEVFICVSYFHVIADLGSKLY